MSFYVAYTWLITGIICPFVAMTGLVIDDGPGEDVWWVPIVYFTIGTFYVIPFFVACGIVSRFVIPVAVNLEADPMLKFLMWLFLSGLVVLTIGTLIGLIMPDLVDDLYLHLWYGILSTWITSIIRYRYFIKLVNTD